MKQLAPIVLFTYCRFANTKETVEHLLKNEEARCSDLIIYSDAPKNEKAIEGVRITREYLHSITGFKSVTIIEREQNLGLANSIVDGVTAVVNKYGRVIVLEDDLSVSPYFLKYMNEGLERYEDRKDIASIHGYIYPVKAKMPEALLIKGADCWGWATWKRAWDVFCFDAKSLYNRIIDAHLEKEFDFNYSYPYVDMLKRQIDGSAGSWAICWYASAFLKDMYTLYPGQSLVQLNDIVGNGATHGSTPIAYLVDVKSTPINWNMVEDQVESLEGRKAFELFFKSLKTWKSYIPNFIINILKIVRKFV
jgi:hypothetical protein